MSQPLLSICIPTYGHDKDLDVALRLLTSLDVFQANDDIEVVISDNCSPDDTERVCRCFVKKWPRRIHYFRNETNIHDDNFDLALRRGNGLFLKLTNDTIVFREKGLREILSAVRKYKEEKPILFFTNQPKEPRQRRCDTLGDFFGEVSMFSTWIGSFGMWKSDMDTFKDFSRMSGLQLSQVDVLCRLLITKRRCEVFNGVFCDSFPRPTKSGYSVSRVFGKNYFTILEPYVKAGELSLAAYNLEKRRILRNQILPFSLTFTHRFNNAGYIRFLLGNFWSDPLYWCALPFVLMTSLLKPLIWNPNGLIAHCLKLLPETFHPLTTFEFRRRNKNNRTYPINRFNPGLVAVGNGSSGGLDVRTIGLPFSRLLIGSHVTIGSGVRFILSENGSCNGPIVISDDVILGDNVTIHSGVIVPRGTTVRANTDIR